MAWPVGLGLGMGVVLGVAEEEEPGGLLLLEDWITRRLGGTAMLVLLDGIVMLLLLEGMTLAVEKVERVRAVRMVERCILI